MKAAKGMQLRMVKDGGLKDGGRHTEHVGTHGVSLQGLLPERSPQSYGDTDPHQS